MSKVLCGVIFENDEHSPIYASVETGDFFYPDAFMGDYRAITGITASTPHEVDFEDVVAEHQAETHGECMGFIYDGDTTILILSDTTAKYADTGKVCTIDLYSDYDDADED